jgi:membrane-bound metal-dependent hydrolase YbcI (DUF457 family)
MYIGHVGVALAAKRMRPSIALAALLVATYTPDWVDSGLCLVRVSNPQGMLSHSIPAIALLALVGFAVYALHTRDWAAALLVAGVILSHMLLDWITGDKPTWPGGPMIGLGLYRYPVADFIVEGLLIVIGVALYRPTLPSHTTPLTDGSIMLGALLVLQLGIDIAHLMMESLPKC